MSRPSRRLWVTAVLAVAAVAGLAASLALRAGPDALVAAQGQAPSTLAGIAVCLPPFDVSAYRTAEGRVVFPINHPGWNHSLDLRPARCFSSERQAQQAGYRIAPPPPGVRVVEEMYLVLAPQDLSAGCRAAGRKLSFRPRCPALVPAGAAWTCAPCLDGRAFVLSGTANAPADYVGVEGGGLHLVVAASRDPRSTRLTCAGMRPAGNLPFRGGRAGLVLCPRGSELHSGHLLAQWTAGGVSYAVSLHGSDRGNRHLLRAFLDALRK